MIWKYNTLWKINPVVPNILDVEDLRQNISMQTCSQQRRTLIFSRHDVDYADQIYCSMLKFSFLQIST